MPNLVQRIIGALILGSGAPHFKVIYYVYGIWPPVCENNTSTMTVYNSPDAA